MAQREGVRVANRKRTQEKSMPQSDNQVEVNEQVPDEIDAALDAALEKAGMPDAKAQAAAEEQRMAALIKQSQEAQEEPAKAPQPDESLVSVMAGGRENLLQKMREHAEKAKAAKEAYKPPPLTDRQRAALEEEQAAGRKARERHEAELASRPPPPAKEKWDGSNTPVMRPGDVVPDPRAVAPNGFAAGTRQYGADA
jgi:hypothetical protein